MNWIFEIIDSLIKWIGRNPLTFILIVMIAVFAPSVFGWIFVTIGIIALVVLALPIFGLIKLRRFTHDMEKQARQQGFGGGNFSGQQRGRTQNSNEGEVKVYTTDEAAEKRVSDNVGEYVDFEEVKNK
jgi:hypothetical protein